MRARSFPIAMGVVGGLVFLQVLAMGYGVLRREPAPSVTPPAAVQAPALPALAPTRRATVVAPVEPRPVASVESEGAGESAAAEIARSLAPPVTDPPVPAAGSPAAASPFLGPAGDPPVGDPAAANAEGGAVEKTPRSGNESLFAALAAAARSRPYQDGILERLMLTGSELRDSGNMQGALQAYRQVENALPDDPRVLSEIGATLGRMGLEPRARNYWAKVERLGEIAAGPYHAIASRRLRGEEEPSALAAAPIAPVSAGIPVKTLKIGEVKVEEPVASEEGQRVALSVVIDADPALKPAADDLSLLVYFFDRLPGGEVEPSTAQTSYLYPTEPYDWQVGGSETIVVNYHQPRNESGTPTDPAPRVFHGYMIELYYRDELQDKVTMPEELAGMRFDATEGAAPAGPENALFPTPVP